MKYAAILAVVLLGAGAAFAGVKDFAGPWHLSLHGKRCDLRLLEKRAAHGFALAQKCPDAFGVQSAIAWKPYDGGIVFLSDTGAPAITFQATEDIYLSSNNPELALRK